MEVSALPHPSTITGLRGPTALLRLQSDERLIALTRRGHHAAFEVLCSRYHARLLAFCRHMLSSKEDAEDVLQEVFAASFNAVLADDRPINVRPWLYRIARNRSLNHLRRNTATGVDSMDIHFAENGISTGDKVLRRESFRELIADVHELPETQRTALLLREIDAMSYEQIAQAMETTVPSVKSLLVRARISLAEAAEARRLSCDEVRLELGEVAEGLGKLSAGARRHVRGCDRCAKFKKQLRENNHALAALMPVGVVLMLKRLIVTKLTAGGAHVAGGAGATVGASASLGAAAGGSSLAGGVMTAGAGAIATKAAAGLAAAALVAAGAVAADKAVVAPAEHPHHRAVAASVAPSPLEEASSGAPAVTLVRPQPLTVGTTSLVARHAAAVRARRARLAKAAAGAQKTPPTVPAPAPAGAVAPAAAATPTTPSVTPAPVKAGEPGQPPVQVTEVTSEATQLPTSATSGETTTVTTPAPTAPVTGGPAPATPEAPPAEAAVESSTGATPGAGGAEAPAPTGRGARLERALIRAGRRAASHR